MISGLLENLSISSVHNLRTLESVERSGFMAKEMSARRGRLNYCEGERPSGNS